MFNSSCRRLPLRSSLSSTEPAIHFRAFQSISSQLMSRLSILSSTRPAIHFTTHHVSPIHYHGGLVLACRSFQVIAAAIHTLTYLPFISVQLTASQRQSLLVLARPRLDTPAIHFNTDHVTSKPHTDPLHRTCHSFHVRAGQIRAGQILSLPRLACHSIHFTSRHVTDNQFHASPCIAC